MLSPSSEIATAHLNSTPKTEYCNVVVYSDNGAWAPAETLRNNDECSIAKTLASERCRINGGDDGFHKCEYKVIIDAGHCMTVMHYVTLSGRNWMHFRSGKDPEEVEFQKYDAAKRRPGSKIININGWCPTYR